MLQRAQTIVIDGSNVIHAIFEPWPGSHEEQNQQAVDFMDHLSHWLYQKLELNVEIVFDGGYRLLLGHANSDRLRVLFSHHDSADEIILERVRTLRYFKSKVTVVTRDRALAEEAQKENARVMTPERLWSKIVNPNNR